MTRATTEKQPRANGTSDTNAVTFLTHQHDEVDVLLGKIAKARSPEKKRAYFEELADKLAAHVAIEETLFYPVVKDAGSKIHDLVMESVEEHLAIKRVLADLLALDVSHESFAPKLEVLKEEIEHHAREEEEKNLFPRVSKAFDEDELEQLGAKLADRYDHLMLHQPRLAVPAQTAEAAPV